MRYASRGNRTSRPEVGNVSKHGLWLLVGGKELFLAFRDFPWFRDATIAQLVNVKLQGPNHLCWPELDVDLALESIEHPEQFPLVSRESKGVPPRRACKPRGSSGRTSKRSHC